jgi:exodeoxyribonuclease V alpha subunit
MTTHLSARLAWHDRAWDGCACDAPHVNAHCIV